MPLASPPSSAPPEIRVRPMSGPSLRHDSQLPHFYSVKLLCTSEWPAKEGTRALRRSCLVRCWPKKLDMMHCLMASPLCCRIISSLYTSPTQHEYEYEEHNLTSDAWRQPTSIPIGSNGYSGEDHRNSPWWRQK
jgi:hypothetical protein